MKRDELIQVRVIPKAKKNNLKQEGNKLKVYLTAPPVEGKANKLLVELLAQHFKLKKSRIKIVKGEKSRDKLVRIGI
ncbi:MAG: YggU family protein [Nitrospirae bacterium]|nr:YggU family protein [Nitrospirota bacterium]